MDHKTRCWFASSALFTIKKRTKTNISFHTFSTWVTLPVIRNVDTHYLYGYGLLFKRKKKRSVWTDPEHQSDNYCIL